MSDAKQSRFPLIYWRKAAPEDGSLLQPSRVAWNGSGLRLEQLAGRLLDSLEPAPARPEITAQLSPDGGAVETLSAETAAAVVPASPRFLQVRETGGELEIGHIAARTAERPVLIPAGTAFLGGAQNRMVLHPTLLPAGSERLLDVFCVEAGRWDRGEERFHSVGRVPDLLLLNFLKKALNDSVQRDVMQHHAWETIFESLVLSGRLNETMDLMRYADGRSVPLLRDAATPNPVPEDSRVTAYFSRDRSTGMSNLGIYPTGEHLVEALHDHRLEDEWRRGFRREVPGAREYFRIFDERQALAIRCLADGRALKDLRGRPVLFEYGPADLEHSFRPPLEAPPPQEPLDLSHEQGIEGWQEMRAALRECRVEVSAATPARRGLPAKTGEVHRLTFAHPTLALMGSGLMMDRRPVYLEAAAFRAKS